MSKNLNLTLSLDKINLILAGLGELPAEISQIHILKIQKEAQSQIDSSEGEKDLEFAFSLDEVNAFLQGLGKLPAKMSMALIIEIQESAKKQLGDKPQSQSKVEENSSENEDSKLEHKPVHIEVSHSSHE